MGRFQDAQQIVGRYDKATANLEQATVVRLFRALDKSYRSLTSDLEKGWDKVAKNRSIFPQQQRLLLLDQLGDLINLTAPSAKSSYENLLYSAIEKGAEGGLVMTDRLMEAIDPSAETLEILRSTTGVPVEALKNQASEGLRRLYRYGEDGASAISAIVEQGLVQNWGPRKVADAIRAGVVGVVKSKAETLARTEIMSSFNGAAKLRIQQHGAKLLWQSQGKDRLTCPVCVSRNMQVFDPTQIQFQAHPRCRCVAVPWREDWIEAGVIDAGDLEFMLQYRQGGLDSLAEAGLRPKAAAPFDLPGGPPKVLWQPSAAEVARAQQIATAPKAPAKKTTKPPDFPDSIDVLEEVRSLGGSTGATLVRHPLTGQQYVLKRGGSADHLREEFAADEAYRALGVNVPKAKLYETPGGPTKLAEFIDGESLADVIARGNKAELDRVLGKVRKDFAADALIGNWDVIGLDADNILVSRTGTVYRIDNGGAFRFRAQGGGKGTGWNGYPTELFSMRDARVNRRAAEAFGTLSHNEVIAQIEALGKKRARLLRALPDDLKAVVGDRLEEMARLSRISRVLEADDWKEDYRELFTKHSLGLRNAGLIDRLPKRFELSSRNQVYDESGRKFDHLRGPGGLVQDLEDYLDKNGGNYKIIADWAASQAGSSWSNESRALKRFIADCRDTPLDRYYWRGGPDDAARRLGLEMQRYGDQAYRESFSAFHVWNYELLQAIDMPNNDRGRSVFRAVRTEGRDVMRLHNMRPGDSGVLQRGAAESYSMFLRVEVHGTETTVQDLPHHRVFGMYLQSRNAGGLDAMFLGDGENEIVALGEGLQIDYLRSGQWQNAAPTYHGSVPAP